MVARIEWGIPHKVEKDRKIANAHGSHMITFNDFNFNVALEQYVNSKIIYILKFMCQIYLWMTTFSSHGK